MNLCELSFETLQYVTLKLRLAEVFLLWSTGSRALQFKLANGGVSGVDATVIEPNTLLKWPSLFTCLRKLDKFRFCSGQSAQNPQLNVSHVAALSVNLQSLTLHVPGALAALNELWTRDSQALSALITLSVTDSVGLGSLRVGIPWPRKLQQLCLFSDQPVAFYTLDLATLPTSLTFLAGNFNQVLLDGVNQFPSALNSLRLTLSHWTNFLPLLPSGLESFCLHHAGWENMADFPEYHFWETDGVSSLPRDLRSLELPLPSYSAHMLQNLPQNLTSILHHHRPIEPEDMPFLPPLLKHTACLMPYIIRKSFAHYIPASLETAEMFVQDDAVPHLKCTNLEVLSINGSVATLTAELQSLNLSKIPPIAKFISFSGGLHDVIPLLPTGLRRLTLSQIPLSTSQILALPPTLEILIYNTYSLAQRLEDWKLLPNSLHTVISGHSQPLTADASQYIPRNLTKLSIYNAEGISEKWFEGLPTRLQELCISLENADPYAFNYELITLPPSLTSLSFTSMPQLRDAAHSRVLLQKIPKSVRYLYLSVSGRAPILPIDESDDKQLEKSVDILLLPHRV